MAKFGTHPATICLAASPWFCQAAAAAALLIASTSMTALFVHRPIDGGGSAGIAPSSVTVVRNVVSTVGAAAVTLDDVAGCCSEAGFLMSA